MHAVIDKVSRKKDIIQLMKNLYRHNYLSNNSNIRYYDEVSNIDVQFHSLSSTELLCWRRNKEGGLDIYYDDMENCKEKTFIKDSIIAVTIIIAQNENKMCRM